MSDAARPEELETVEHSEAEAVLAAIMPLLITAESVVARLKEMMAGRARELAKERGVPFIRDEQLRQEFGGQP